MRKMINCYSIWAASFLSGNSFDLGEIYGKKFKKFWEQLDTGSSYIDRGTDRQCRWGRAVAGFAVVETNIVYRIESSNSGPEVFEHHIRL
jgi:hypothetical protein